MTLDQWAIRWSISPTALKELADMSISDSLTSNIALNEAAIQTKVRLEAARVGCRLWRNNVGVAVGANGRYVRYGIANDSKQLNDHIKSSDLIGIMPITITSEHVGKIIGQFVCREIKHGNWTYAKTPREQAQLAWITLIKSLGGNACFVSGEGSFNEYAK